MSLLDKASLVQIPSGYKATKLYSVVPESGVGDLSFARSSSGTRVNEQGLIETIAIDTPRIDYTGGGCGKLLLEGQRTNSIPRSEDLSSLWNFINVDKALTQVKNPSGNLGVYEIAATSTSGSHYFEPSTYSATSGADYTFSFFAKINGSNFVQVALSTGFSPLYQNFNLLDGTLGNGNLTSGYSSSIEPFGNGWYRVSVKGTTISANARFLTIPIITDIASRNPSFNGDGTSGVYVWGFQREAGSYPTSYIPTQGSAATRNQDTSSTTGLSSVIGQVGGVLYFNAAAQNDSINGRISIGDGSFNNRVMVSYTSIPNQIRVQIASGGSNVFSQNYTLTNATDFNKIAVKWNLNDFSVWVNSIEVLTGNSGNIPLGMDTLSFNRSGSNSRYFYGEVKELAVFFTALSDAELETLTTL